MIGIHMHYSLRFITYFLCCTVCLPASLSGCFFKDVSLLQMIGDTRTKEYRAALPGLPDRWGRKNLNVHTYTHPVCISWVQGL